MKEKLQALTEKKKAPKVDVTADISSNESGSDYEFECSDVSDDEENPIGKSGTRKKESKAESRQKEDEDITELKKREDNRKQLEEEANQAKINLDKQRAERKKYEEQISVKELELEQKMERLRKKRSDVEESKDDKGEREPIKERDPNKPKRSIEDLKKKYLKQDKKLKKKNDN